MLKTIYIEITMRFSLKFFVSQVNSLLHNLPKDLIKIIIEYCQICLNLYKKIFLKDLDTHATPVGINIFNNRIHIIEDGYRIYEYNKNVEIIKKYDYRSEIDKIDYHILKMAAGKDKLIVAYDDRFIDIIDKKTGKITLLNFLKNSIKNFNIKTEFEKIYWQYHKGHIYVMQPESKMFKKFDLNAKCIRNKRYSGNIETNELNDFYISSKGKMYMKAKNNIKIMDLQGNQGGSIAINLQLYNLNKIIVENNYVYAIDNSGKLIIFNMSGETIYNNNNNCFRDIFVENNCLYALTGYDLIAYNIF